MRRGIVFGAVAALILTFVEPIAAQEPRIFVDFRASSLEEWEIVSDGYSASDTIPSLKALELDTNEKYLGLFLSFPTNTTPAYYFLRAKKEWKNVDMRVVHSIRLTLFGIQALCSLGVVIEDGKKNLFEIPMGDIDFYGGRTIESIVSIPLDGLLVKGITIYPSQSSTDQGSDIAIYLKDLEIRGGKGAGEKP
ncbi:MAG: hypothetical protein ABSG21_04950 [Spirochaetia bacterium]|jgi:hypothetical protein